MSTLVFGNGGILTPGLNEYLEEQNNSQDNVGKGIGGLLGLLTSPFRPREINLDPIELPQSQPSKTDYTPVIITMGVISLAALGVWAQANAKSK